MNMTNMEGGEQLAQVTYHVNLSLLFLQETLKQDWVDKYLFSVMQVCREAAILGHGCV